MTEFKVGDRVECVDSNYHFSPAKGIIVDIPSDNLYRIKIIWCFSDPRCLGGVYTFYRDEIKLISNRGRPSKPKSVKYIAFYDEQDQDPSKKFYSRKELTDWLKEARDDEKIIFSSIEVYEVKKPLKPELYVRLK